MKVDTSAPTGGALTVNGTAAAAAPTSSFTNSTSVTINSRTDYTDAASGLASSTLTRTTATLSNNTCGSFGSATVVAGTTTQSGLSTNCYQFTLVGTDNAGNIASISTIVKVDTAAPTGGAVTVNGTAASGAGTSSFNGSGTVLINSRTDYTDAASGLASSTLTIASGTLTNNVCGSFGAPSVIVGTTTQSPLATGCYQFVLTGTDNAGGTREHLHDRQGRHERAYWRRGDGERHVRGRGADHEASTRRVRSRSTAAPTTRTRLPVSRRAR